MHLLIVDNHGLFRQGLKLLLAGLAQSVEFHEADGVSSALAFAEQPDGPRADLVLLELDLPGCSGTQALEAVRRALPQARFVVLSGADHPGLIRRAIDKGASGFVSKASSTPVLLAALQLVMSGGIYLPLDVLREAESPEAPIARRSRRALLSQLTLRQREVLIGLMQGKPNKAIAREIGISESTVKLHMSTMFRVLGVRNRTQAAYVGAQLGLSRGAGRAEQG